MTELGPSRDLGVHISKALGVRYDPSIDNCIGVFRDGVVLGGVVLRDFNGVDVTLDMMGGDGWLTRMVLQNVFDFVFNILKANRASCRTVSTNPDYTNMLRRMGWEVEGVSKGAVPDGDRLNWVMWKDKCPWVTGAVHGRRYLQ